MKRLEAGSTKITITDDLGMNAGPTAPEWQTLSVCRFLLSTQSFSVHDVTNTTAETDFIVYTIPANTFPTKCIDVVCEAEYLNTSGGSTTPTIRIYHGATKIFDDDSASFGSSSTVIGFTFKFRIWRNTTDAVTRCMGWTTSTLEAGTAPTTGRAGDFSTDETSVYTVFNCADSTQSITANQDFKVTMQHSGSASSSKSFKRLYYRVVTVG